MEIGSAGDGFERKYSCFCFRSIQSESEQLDERRKRSDETGGF
jgi:hypothetical protein